MSGLGYKIKFDSGGVITGKLDASGHAHRENVPESAATVEYEQRDPKNDAPWDPLQKLVEKAKSHFSSAPNNTNY